MPERSNSKLLRTFRARHHILDRYHTWGKTHRDPTRPLLWVHAPSVGEGLMALPLLQQFRAHYPTVQLAYTFFSPSAERLARTLKVDFADYLPFDTPNAARHALNTLKPSVLIFSKLDVWPNLVDCAHAHGVKLGMISAAMSATSARSRGLGAAITRDAYAKLDRVGAASEGDARALISAGVRPGHVTVTGDTRYDQAWTRAHVTPQNIEITERLESQRFTLVAGSTWPADERILLPAWLRVRARIHTARLIIAPHEIDESHLERITTWARTHQLTMTRTLGEDADVILVDRVGVLADLYSVATAAYVGGGFHSHGLHSVVEPAVFQVPVLVGPRSTQSRDAMVMQQDGGLTIVDSDTEMAERLIQIATDDALRQSMRHALATTVSRERGATQRAFELVRDLLGPMQEKSLHEVHA